VESLYYIFLEPGRVFRGMDRQSGPFRPLLILWLSSLFLVTSSMNRGIHESFIHSTGLTLFFLLLLILGTGVLHLFMSFYLPNRGDPVVLLYCLMFSSFPAILLPLAGDMMERAGKLADELLVIFVAIAIFRALLASIAETYRVGYFTSLNSLFISFGGIVLLFTGAIALL